MHAGVSFAEPATSTMHSRHDPVSDSPSRWHIVGMWMPFSVATARIVWPSHSSHVGPVDPQRVDGRHARTGDGSIVQTPAGQTRSTMWARYSSRK